MADGYGMIERWTLRSLAGDFLELAIACIFLCAAAAAFAAAKLFSLLFGVDLSCRHSPPFPSRPSLADCPSPPSPPPSCSPPPHRPLLILDSNSRGESSESIDPLTDEQDQIEENCDCESTTFEKLKRIMEEETDEQDQIEENCDCELTRFEKLKLIMEDERAARAMLSRELEAERSAAAGAADEAMAMMLRLQEEKAAAEIEARQCRRTAEEKSAYDAAEMETLKAIVLRRERENFALEMQLEECRQQLIMLMNNNDGCGGSSNDDGCSGDDAGDINLGLIDQNDDGATDGRVYDVHVVDDDYQNAEHSKPSYTESGSSSEAAATADRSNDDTSSSLSAIVDDTEKLVLEKEVTILRKRLEAIQQGREKLRFPSDRAGAEKESLRLQILKEISYQLEEIKKSTEEAGEY